MLKKKRIEKGKGAKAKTGTGHPSAEKNVFLLHGEKLRVV